MRLLPIQFRFSRKLVVFLMVAFFCWSYARDIENNGNDKRQSREKVHYLVYCMIAAYSMQRTFLIDGKGWRYSNNGWDSVFQPISKCQVTDQIRNQKKQWTGNQLIDDRERVLAIPTTNPYPPLSPYIPMSFPQDLATTLILNHKFPPAWWVGQITAYMMRLNDESARQLKVYQNKHMIKHPVVGVHIRTTDKIIKGAEGKLHQISEYMDAVNTWYDDLDKSVNITHVRRVFVATDDAKNIKLVRKSYPSLEIYGDEGNAQSATRDKDRYKEDSLRNVVIDIFQLAHSDFLICTMTSHICSLSYEIMQTFFEHEDASDKFRSLDDIYHFPGQHYHMHEVIEDHDPPPGDLKFMTLKIGDVVEVMRPGKTGPYPPGTSKGFNIRTNRVGFYWLSKVRNKWRTPAFPSFANSSIDV